MELYEVSKSGKSVNKFIFNSNEKMMEYKKVRGNSINLYQFETGDYALFNRIRELNSIPLCEFSDNKSVDVHSRLGNFDMKEIIKYSEAKRLSPMYYYSLAERTELEDLWLQYLEGTYQSSNLLDVYLGEEESKMTHCNHLLLPKKYHTLYPPMLDDTVLTPRAENARPVYTMKNILDLPEELYVLELLEHARYQKILDLSLDISQEVLSCYDWVAQDLYKIDILKDESMCEIASTLDAQKSMLKSIRQNAPWKMKK